MIDTLLESLDVTIKHGASAAATHAMPNSVNIKPLLGRFFAAANPVSDCGIKNFGASASDGAKARFAEKLERFWDRHLEDSLSAMANFNRSKGFDVEIGIGRAQSAQQIEIPLFLQGRMQTADDRQLRSPQRKCFCDNLNDLAHGLLGRMGLPFFGGNRAILPR